MYGTSSLERTQSLDDNFEYQTLLYDLSKYSPNHNTSVNYSDQRNHLMSRPFRIVDVYDVAAEIGKDFERIIDQFGSEAVSGLMPRVIGVLEELEEYAQRYESEAQEIVSLQENVQKLELESIARAQEKSRHEKDLEQIEEAWRTETHDLMQMIEKLQEDNRKLHEELDNVLETTEEIHTTKVKDSKVTMEHHVESVANDEVQLMIRLKEMVDRQTQEIRELKKELSQKCLDLDAMQQQSERLAKLNAELRRKHCVSKKQSEQLLDEKSQLQVELCAKDNEIKKMRQHVVHQVTGDTIGAAAASNMIDTITEEIGGYKEHEGSNSQEFEESLARLSEAQLIEQINMEDKMSSIGIVDPLINKASGNKKFRIHKDGSCEDQNGSTSSKSGTKVSLSQLKAVLVERNELKARLIEVEEELAVYKNAGDDEPPVQGPINREPDEKVTLESKKETGVQRFFQSLLEKINGP